LECEYVFFLLNGLALARRLRLDNRTSDLRPNNVAVAVLVIEGVTFLLVRKGIARALLAAAMLMDLVPLGIFALHLARADQY
jgi:hypothetical protein